MRIHIEFLLFFLSNLATDLFIFLIILIDNVSFNLQNRPKANIVFDVCDTQPVHTWTELYNMILI